MKLKSGWRDDVWCEGNEYEIHTNNFANLGTANRKASTNKLMWIPSIQIPLYDVSNGIIMIYWETLYCLICHRWISITFHKWNILLKQM